MIGENAPQQTLGKFNQNASQIECAEAIAESRYNITGNMPVITTDVDIAKDGVAGPNLRILTGSLESINFVMDKWTKRGAIIGGIWGLLVLPNYVLIYMLFGDIPSLLGHFLFLPFVGAILKYLVLSDSMISGTFINFVGWVLIGGILGYLYGFIRGDKK